MTPAEVRGAASEALRRAAVRLERASSRLAPSRSRWGDAPPRESQLRPWREAWGDYVAAVELAYALCPRRLTAGQRLLARVGAERGAAPRRPSPLPARP